MTDLDEDLSAAAEEAERELEGEEESSEEEETEAEIEEENDPLPVAAVIPQTTTVPRKRRRRGPPARGSSQVATLGPPQVRSANDGTKNIALIWASLCEDLMQKGSSAGAVWIRIKKFVIGPNRTPASAAEDMQPIDGAAVCGSEAVTPGEELIQYVTDVFHMTSSVPGPARYVFNFYYKTGSANHIAAAEGELILGDPREIKQRREAARAIQNRREMERGYGGAGMGLGYAPAMTSSLGGGSRPWVPPSQVSAVAAPVPAPVAPPPVFVGASPELEAERRRLYEMGIQIAQERGVYEERARREGLEAARPVAAPVDSQEIIEARIANGVMKALLASGLIPPAHAPLTPAAVATAVTDPLTLMDGLFKQMTAFRAMEDRMRDMYAPDEPEEAKPVAIVPVVPQTLVPEKDPYALVEVPFSGALVGKPLLNRPKKPEEGMAEYIIQIGMANPEAAMKIAEKVVNGPLGNAVVKLLSNTAIGQALAQRQGAQGQGQGQVVEMPTHTNGQPNNQPAAHHPAPPSSGIFAGGPKPFKPTG